MGRQATSVRLKRLGELQGLLAAGGSATAGGLADELGVSVRTLHRDLAVLREGGVPIEAERGRGGGVRMHRNWSLGPLRLTPEEAMDLLLSIAIAERMESPVFLRQLKAVKRKVAAAFSDADRPKIRSVRKRILVGSSASQAVLETTEATRGNAPAGLAEAFMHQRCVRLDYVDGKGAKTTRVVEPQFLYLSVPVWYLLGWDRLREGVRTFRMDRIQSVLPLESGFRLVDPEPFLEQVEAEIETL